MGMHSYLTGFVAALLAICGQAAPFAYIGNASLAKVSVIDTASNSVVAEVKLPEPGVTGFAASADGRRVYAANSHHLFVIDAVTNVVAASLRSDRALAVTPVLQ